MAPSRGLNRFLVPRIHVPNPHIRKYGDFTRTATNPNSTTQIYISRTQNPYLNLSIEHYLLRQTPSKSTVLFLYTNAPSIILGRNQNPWVEINLRLVRSSPLNISIVRRRSGGGTVFHDEGNLNYSVICPTAVFHRDKHAEMTVRALRKLGVVNVRVNERHDIVVDKVSDKDGQEKTFKVSGSAYKLTRERSLHHGTCLLSSPNLGVIGKLLSADLKSFLKARGVDSVSSAITNVWVKNRPFEEAVVDEFSQMYGAAKPIIVGEDLENVPEVAEGFKELKSEDWIYCQTPQFTFSTEATAENGRPPKFDFPLPGNPQTSPTPQPKFSLDFTAKHGCISDLSLSYPQHITASEANLITSSLRDQKLHEITDWESALLAPLSKVSRMLEPTNGSTKTEEKLRSAGKAMNHLFGVG